MRVAALLAEIRVADDKGVDPHPQDYQAAQEGLRPLGVLRAQALDTTFDTTYRLFDRGHSC